MTKETIIQEMRLIETEDGFRLEVTGDKEKLKAMGFGPGLFGLRRGFGRNHRQHGRRRRRPVRRHRHGPWRDSQPVGRPEKGPQDASPDIA